MKLEQLLYGIDCKIFGNKNIEVEGIVQNSAQVTKNCCFVAIVGANIDGHTKCKEAAKHGAVVVVVEHKVNIKNDITQVVVKSTRKVVGRLASNFFSNPSKDMKMVGVTGTNGKTSTTYMIKHICEKNDLVAGVIGTSGCVWKDKCVQTGMTTPDPIELQKILRQMKDDGVQVVAMEVSAHALYFSKLEGITFDVAVFTNLTQDHLDFFGNMKKYMQAKQMLFDEHMSKHAVVCVNSAFGRKLSKHTKIPISTFGFSRADFCICGLTATNFGQKFMVKNKRKKCKVELPLFGEFNAVNALGAIATCSVLGVGLEEVSASFVDLPKIDGRFNGYSCKNGALVVIDYAHTPDGLLNVLKCGKQLAKKRHGKLWSLFGCGGNRDATKRPIMGQISQRLADFSVITSDNPRLEDPQSIIDMITNQMNKKQYISFVDRKEAICYAISKLSEHDVLLVCGKGAENYIDIGGQKLEYSDEKTIKEKIEEN